MDSIKNFTPEDLMNDNPETVRCMEYLNKMIERMNNTGLSGFGFDKAKFKYAGWVGIVDHFSKRGFKIVEREGYGDDSFMFFEW